jgi:hypothetical protein
VVERIQPIAKREDPRTPESKRDQGADHEELADVKAGNETEFILP